MTPLSDDDDDDGNSVVIFIFIGRSVGHFLKIVLYYGVLDIDR